MSDDESQRVVANVDSDAHEMAKEKLDHGEMSEIIRDVVNTVAFGGGWDRHTLLDRQIGKKEEDLRKLRERRRDIDAKIENQEGELRKLRREREETETREQRLEGALWSFEQSLRAGEYGHVTPDHPKLKNLASEFGQEVEVVHSELVERNPDIPEAVFEEYDSHDPLTEPFTGISDEEVGTPVDERRSL